MKRTVLILMSGLLLIAVTAFTAGDMHVMGKLGIGTESPNTELDVRGDVQINGGTLSHKTEQFTWPIPHFGFDGNIVIEGTGGSANFKGLWLEEGLSGGFVKKNGYSAPLISGDSVFLGTDSAAVALAWDTGFDGQWGYCEGVSMDTGTINCANYSGLMDSNDYYFIWKHGFPNDSQSWCTGDCRESRRDLKFIFDGEDNDGVMGFMEDEDEFFFDDKVVVNDSLTVNGLPTSAPDTSSDSYIVCIDPSGNLWVDNDGTNDCD